MTAPAGVNNTVPFYSDHSYNTMIDFERQQFFWSRVQKDGDHLIWTGTKVPRGYGIITIQGKEEYAHRVAYCIAQNIDLSAIKEFHLVRINCNRNDCVEPTHFAPKPKTPRLIAKEKKKRST